MDYAILPPEVNSGRIYAGPGSGPMLAAALAWDGLATELYAAAGSYQSVVSGLIAGPWSGPSSAAMAAAGASYVAWLSATAAQAEQTASQAKAAAAAYEAAFVSTVPPPMIAANRSLLMALVATNFFGQNTPAIAATEAEYAEMWAQDAAAMYGYAASSALATVLTPFSSPRQNTNPVGKAGQAATVAQALGTSPGNAQSVVSSVQTFSAVPNALQSLATAAPAAAADPPSALSTLSSLIGVFLAAPSDLATLGVETPTAPLGLISLPFSVEGALSGLHADEIVSGWNGEQTWPGTGPAPVTEFPAIITNPGPLAPSAPAVSAGFGEANTVGGLSVPSAWTVASPTVRPVALTLPTSGAGATAAAAGEAMEAGSSSTFNQMALAGMAGRAMAGPAGAGGGDSGNSAPGTQVAAPAGGKVGTGEGAAGDSKVDASHGNPRIVVTGVAARIRELAMLRDEGRMTDEEYTEQKNILLGRSTRHRPLT